ncbi:MAG: hypothetical protein ACRDGA_01380, partial [Bacteroidota bacterium]
MAALVVAVSFDRWEKTWFALFFLFVLLHIPYVTVTGPQIFAFNPVVGFFPGITYDETMQVENRLALYRWATMAAAVVLFTIAVIIHRARSRNRLLYEDGAPVRAKIVHPAELITGLLLLLALAGVMTFSEELGFSSSTSYIEAQLGGTIETQHFIIAYPAQAVRREQAKQLGLLHEYYFATLARELRVVSVKKIHSFLYATPAQKGTLVGAARTNIAKPWLWQIHFNLNDLEASLKHELVHVMAAEFGFPLFRVGLNSGLIEGLATAVERVQGDETLHRAAAQIFSVNIRTDMKSLFSLSGFARAHPGVGYSLAGSFCRFLIDRYGIRRFKRLYRSGDFRLVYSNEIDILLSEWRRHVEQYRVDDAERQKAAYLYKRPTIFGKECARVLANLNAETRRHLEQGQY